MSEHPQSDEQPSTPADDRRPTHVIRTRNRPDYTPTQPLVSDPGRRDAGTDPNATIPPPIRIEADPANLAPLTHAYRDFKQCLSVDHAVRATLRHRLKLHRRSPSALMGLIKKWVCAVTSDRPPCAYHDLPANGPPRHDSHAIVADPMAWQGGRQHATHPDLVGPPTVSEVVVATVSGRAGRRPATRVTTHDLS